MSLADRAKAAANETGFQRHPVGVYAAVVTEVKEREHEGQLLYEVHVETNAGKAKVTLWKTTVDDVENGYGGKLDRAKAEERYVRSIGRILRLYRDLGLEEPAGNSEVELEAECYMRLGELQGRACEIVVQPSKNPAKPGDVVVYINAPKPGAAAPATAFGGPVGIDDIF